MHLLFTADEVKLANGLYEAYMIHPKSQDDSIVAHIMNLYDLSLLLSLI